MGRHLIYIIPVLKPTMMTMYINNASYHTTTVCIKISLLLQYLRMFRNGARRIVCKVVLGLVGVWSLVFLFMAWFPCFPVSAFWTRAPGAKCYGYGYSSVGEAKASVLAFAATNMMFDFIIFAIPLTEYCRNNLRRKEVIAMTGLFAFGAMLVHRRDLLRYWLTHFLQCCFDVRSASLGYVQTQQEFNPEFRLCLVRNNSLVLNHSEMGPSLMLDCIGGTPKSSSFPSSKSVSQSCAPQCPSSGLPSSPTGGISSSPTKSASRLTSASIALPRTKSNSRGRDR